MEIERCLHKEDPNLFHPQLQMTEKRVKIKVKFPYRLGESTKQTTKVKETWELRVKEISL